MPATQITKQDTNPIVILLCNWFVLGFLGYHLMGQKQKSIACLLYVVVGSVLFGLGAIFNILGAVDAFLVAKKLQAGETIASDYCAIEFLSRLPLWKEN